MSKFKIQYVKFIFTPKLNRGNDWATPSELPTLFGNRYSDKVHKCQYNRNHISRLLSDYVDDDRRYDNKVKFTTSEASIAYLQYLENELSDAKKNKRQLDRWEKQRKEIFDKPEVSDGHKAYSSAQSEYARTVNNRELAYNTKAIKIWKQKVKEIKESREYLWEQLLR